MKIKMKRSFKVIALLTAVILFAGMFSGCGQKKTDKDEQGRTIVAVGAWPDKEGPTLNAYNERKERYEEENPDAVIDPVSWAFDIKSFYAKAAGGQLPGIYPTRFTEVPQIIDSGYSADLTDTLKKRGYDGMFNPQILDLVSRDGKVYAFPTACYILGLAYNTEMFEAAGLMEADGTPKQPKDWNEVVEFAKKIKEATGKPGFILPTANRSGGWIFTSIAWSFGVDFMEQDENGKWKATFNSPEMVEALEWFKSLRWEHDIIPTNALIDRSEWFKTFGTGGAAMTITAGDYPKDVIKYDMDLEHIGMMAIPAGPKRHVTLLGGEVYCIRDDATEDQIDAALRWLEMSSHYKATDNFKAISEENMKINLDKGQHIGIKSMSPWSGEAESLVYLNELIDKNINANPNHVRLYNEFVENCTADIQAEEPVCAQDLYNVLDGCLQEVLTNKEADCAKLIEGAAADFQANYLDNLTY